MFKLLKFLIFVVVLVALGVMFLPLGSVDYKDPGMAGTLRVPSFAVFEGETGNYEAKFKSVRSGWALEQEFEKILQENYIKHECEDGEVVYYDQKNYLTIYGYTIEQGFPFNSFVVDYKRGNQC